MNLSAIKKYPSQISSAFKRFPLASSLTFLIFFSLVLITESSYLFESYFSRTLLWLGVYPAAATIIALTTALVQESRKSTSQAPQAIASGSWFALSIILIFAILNKETDSAIYVAATIALIYIVVSLGLFIAPFWQQKNEKGFWMFLQKNFKAALAAVVVSAILLGAVEGLVIGFSALFDIDPSEDALLYIFYFCASVVAPILFFIGIPSIDECLDESPALSKFVTSTIRFLFIPVLSIGLFLFYGYIIKFIALWNMPTATASFFVTGFMVYMLALVIVMYPVRLTPKPTIETRLLKIFPAACIPLVFLMTIDILNMVVEIGIEEELIYAIYLNIFFYAVIAILLIDRIKLKFRYIAIVFCALFFVATDSPLNAIKMAKYFPSNKEDSNEPVKQNVSETENNDDESFESFKAYISQPENTPLTVPAGVEKALIVDHYYNYDEFEFQGDTLFFRYKPEREDEDADSTIYSFKISRDELKKAEKTTIEANNATLELEYLSTEEWSNDNRSLRMRGILFLK